MNSLIRLVMITMMFSGASWAQNQTIYCPGSLTDPDGDGWGWENNISCVVLDAPADTPVCASPASDPDGDGRGIEEGVECLVDNQLTGIPIEGGVVSIPANGNLPEVERINSIPIEFLRSVVRASDGTFFMHMPALNLLTSLDPQGQVLWQVQISDRNSVDVIALSDDEQTLFLKMAAGEIASYDVQGNFKWITRSFGLVHDWIITSNAIALRRSDLGGSSFIDNSIVSLSLDGNINWEFTPDNRFMAGFSVDNEENIYITVDTATGSEVFFLR